MCDTTKGCVGHLKNIQTKKYVQAMDTKAKSMKQYTLICAKCMIESKQDFVLVDTVNFVTETIMHQLN